MAVLRKGQLAGYVGVLGACFVVATAAGWTSFAERIDNYAYDLVFRLNPPKNPPTHAIVLAVDEATFAKHGGVRRLRGIVGDALNAVAAGHPRVVALDVILSDEQAGSDDAGILSGLTKVKTVLNCELIPGGWEDPLPQFARLQAAVGHVHPDVRSGDGVSRKIPLEMTSPTVRRWALSLETFRLYQNAARIIESPDDLQVGDVVIPAKRADGRLLRIRYSPAGMPMISVNDLLRDPKLAARFENKAVFLGVTAIGAHDTMVSPLGDFLEGVMIHANAFETMADGNFLVSAGDLSVMAICLAWWLAAGLTFWLRSGWPAYALAAVWVLAAHALPVIFFRNNIVLPYFAPAAVAWLSIAGAASYQYFVVRRQLGRSETEKARYQEAIHFVTHEMRTPLTAIQGSSELMGRYNLNEDKRKQIAQMINSESKRLARMIQTFLDVERLSDGQMDLKQEPFAVQEIIDSCVERVRPLAERKQIVLHDAEAVSAEFRGDRELMEYAFYNLLTNAVKYSPANTETFVAWKRDGDAIRLSVTDQGIGMDAKELRNIFRKFYRTKRAEASGEAGTGIGLSIVEQIVTTHGGRMEVTSQPGKGSCFTMVIPVRWIIENPTPPISQSDALHFPKEVKN